MCGRTGKEVRLLRHHKQYEYDSGQTAYLRNKEFLQHAERFAVLCTQCHNAVTYVSRLPKRGKSLFRRLTRRDPTDDPRFSISKQRQQILSVKRAPHTIEAYVTGESDRLPSWLEKRLETTESKRRKRAREFLRDPDEKF